jgi:hypothetical protein
MYARAIIAYRQLLYRLRQRMIRVLQVRLAVVGLNPKSLELKAGILNSARTVSDRVK